MSTVYSQKLDLTRTIPINREHQRLDTLIIYLKQRGHLRVSYSSNPRVNAVEITLRKGNTKLLDILSVICETANLEYQIINDAIVFKHKKGPGPAYSALPEKLTPNLPGIANYDSVKNTFSPPLEMDSLKLGRYGRKLPEFEYGKITLPPVRRRPMATVKSTKLKNDIRFGVYYSYACDLNSFRFVNKDPVFQKFQSEVNFSSTIGVYSVISSKLLISVGLTDVSKDFYLDYNYEVVDKNDPFPIPDKTAVDLRYLEVPIVVGYKMLEAKKVSLWFNGSVLPSFLIDKSERTSYLNKDAVETVYFLETNRTRLFSFSFAMPLHLWLTRNIGMFLEPSYGFTFGTINENAMRENYSVYRLKTGVQLRI
ncbi:MAG TPA: hypothetical protein VIU12_14215 [Chryseolinea sp.]